MCVGVGGGGEGSWSLPRAAASLLPDCTACCALLAWLLSACLIQCLSRLSEFVYDNETTKPHHNIQGLLDLPYNVVYRPHNYAGLDFVSREVTTSPTVITPAAASLVYNFTNMSSSDSLRSRRVPRHR